MIRLAALAALLPTLAQAAPERVTFAEAVRRATAQATSAALAAQEVRRAEALLAEARAGSLPFLGANASYTRLDGDRTQPAPTAADPNATRVVVPAGQKAANLGAQVPLVAPSRWASWAHASEAVDVSRAGAEEVRRAVVLTAARAYLAVLAQKRVVEVSRSAREIARARFDFAHARRAGGIGNALDELRAEQQLATSEAQLENGEVGLVRAQEALGAATGGDAPLDAAEEPSFQAAPAEGQAGFEDRRLDVQAARSRLEAASHVRRDSWTDWLPTLLLSGQAFYNDPASLLTPRTGWQVQFLLSLPIYEGGLRTGQLHERAALEEESRLQLDASLRQARSDVRLALASLSGGEAALASSRRAAERARGALQLATEAYRAGATNDLDVSTAQQQSRDADLQAVIAEDAVRQARLDALAGLGQFP